MRRKKTLALLFGGLIVLGVGVYSIMAPGLPPVVTETSIVTTTTVNGTVTVTSVPVKAQVQVEVLDEDFNVIVKRVFGLSSIGGEPRYLRVNFIMPGGLNFTAYPFYRLEMTGEIIGATTTTGVTTTTYTEIIGNTTTPIVTTITTTKIVEPTTTAPPLPVPPTNTIYPLSIAGPVYGGDIASVIAEHPEYGIPSNGSETVSVVKDLYRIFAEKQPGYYDLYVYFPIEVDGKVLLTDKYVRLTFKWTGDKLELLQVHVP